MADAARPAADAMTAQMVFPYQPKACPVGMPTTMTKSDSQGREWPEAGSDQPPRATRTGVPGPVPTTQGGADVSETLSQGDRSQIVTPPDDSGARPKVNPIDPIRSSQPGRSERARGPDPSTRSDRPLAPASGVDPCLDPIDPRTRRSALAPVEPLKPGLEGPDHPFGG
jgi:hypothetical protein